MAKKASVVDEESIDETLAGTFPASDPPFWSLGWRAAAPPSGARATLQRKGRRVLEAGRKEARIAMRSVEVRLKDRLPDASWRQVMEHRLKRDVLEPLEQRLRHDVLQPFEHRVLQPLEHHFKHGVLDPLMRASSSAASRWRALPWPANKGKGNGHGGVNVSDVMTRDVKSCTLDDTLHRAAQIMWDNDVGCVPVVDASGHVAGIITDRDICMAAFTQGRPLTEIAVSAIASRAVVSVGDGESLPAAETLMRRHQVRRLPVTDTAGCLAGILSMNDLARHIHRLPDHSGDGLDVESVARTLSMISQPRGAPSQS